MENEMKSFAKNGVGNGITKSPMNLVFPENLSVLDLSSRNIDMLDENIKFPPTISELNLSYNNITEVPVCIVKSTSLKSLNISHNNIKNFDDAPTFCHSIEELNISNNNLIAPPYWIWSESPRKLMKLDISGNSALTQTLNTTLSDYLQYKTLVTDLKIYNCRLGNCCILLQTFPKVKILEVGISDFSISKFNNITHIPCEGLEKCCDIERLDLSNTQLYNIDANIYIFKNLIEINISYNRLNHLPIEFCLLNNLEVCILSGNNILYLPDELGNLMKLKQLHLDSNELCMVPERICELENLMVLDLHDNSLHEVPEGIWKIEELDVAQNYLDEPKCNEYSESKEKLRRRKTTNRLNDRKIELEEPDSKHSSCSEYDDELIQCMDQTKPPEPSHANPLSSPEDWDSDDFWTPGNIDKRTRPSQSPWLYYVKQKMNEGNFCPMDLHTVSVEEQLNYHRVFNPKVWHEEPGQFDDYSDDDS